MKFLIMTICLIVLAFSLVSAATNDETILGDQGADEIVNAQNPAEFHYLRKKWLLKKLLHLG
ncbi:AAEL017279-PA [Aedes aegypti]|uniref:AAEL017279-PA n=1 Tax=Aedes aegypti TaxID=7159 RepID=J9HJI5_AEDAE|nr:AAEL017279-PA [Aedes aegypti]